MRHRQTVHITACGCGNFLIIAYRELRAFELRIHERLQQLDPSRSQLSLDATSRVHVRLSQFYGLELEEWPATIGRTAMFLVEHQANQAVNLTLGYSVPMLPLQDSARITVANALQADWAQIIPATTSLYVMGNPPFLGDHTRGADQLADLHDAWGGNKVLSRLDYVTGWHAKALTLFSSPRYRGQWAFVTTNSITQGDQPARLFAPIFDAGWRIKFAHQTFAWSSEAPGAAAVHCVIIGFTQDTKQKGRLFTYPDIKGAPTEVPVRIGINAYLLDARNILVEKRSTPLSLALPKVEYGSKPTDDGNFVISPEQHAEVMADEFAAKYVRPYVGSRELINGQKRWCLWLADLDPEDIGRSAILRTRIDAVRAFRAASKAASTREYPHHHLFRQFGIVEDVPIVGIPEVSSESRRYLPVAHLEPGTIISNKVYGAVDASGLVFAIASSSAFITWMKAVGGRMKSDMSFSSTITWNNFPLPEVTESQAAQIITAGHAVLEARAQRPERSLAAHYHPLSMSPSLVKAHDQLDRSVDALLGRKVRSNDDRAKLLFDQYAELTSTASKR